MYAQDFEFVSLLRAEERCSACGASHALVEQHACAECGQSTCPECTTLRPDTAWVCVPCTRRAPSRAIAVTSRWRAPRVTRRILRQLGAQLVRDLAAAPRRGLDTLAEWPLRRHARAVGLATALLVSVARSDDDVAQKS